MWSQPSGERGTGQEGATTDGGSAQPGTTPPFSLFRGSPARERVLQHVLDGTPISSPPSTASDGYSARGSSVYVPVSPAEVVVTRTWYVRVSDPLLFRTRGSITDRVMYAPPWSYACMM